VVLACRSPEKAEPALAQIRAEVPGAEVELLPLDLASLASVRRSAEAFLARDLPLHVLVNNAGLAGQRGVTEDGFEMTFGVNHLGHFLFTLLLLPRLVASAPARIVNVSSKAHYDAKGIDFGRLRESTRTTTGLAEYAVSKLANVLFTRELARRLEGTGVTTYALHPGVVATDVWRRIPFPFDALMKAFMISPEKGAETTLHCATSPALAKESGRYYDACKEKRPSDRALDDALARELWAKSLEWTGAPDWPR
jgi:NAD(P)-dependent dehydrogenase (short-subunit alcohol dehydrogenase family)